MDMVNQTEMVIEIRTKTNSKFFICLSFVVSKITARKAGSLFNLTIELLEM